MLAAPPDTPWMTATEYKDSTLLRGLGHRPLLPQRGMHGLPEPIERHDYRGPTVCPLLVLDRRAESMPVWLLCMQPHPSRSPCHLFLAVDPGLAQKMQY